MQWTPVLIGEAAFAHHVYVCIERPSAALPPEVMSPETWLITLVGVQIRVGREPKGPGVTLHSHVHYKDI